MYMLIDEQLAEGVYIVDIKLEDVRVVRAKKHYFSMITELGKYLGYQSRVDRELFKEQIRKELGNESLAEMQEFQDVYTKIEELHEFALTNFRYTFKPWVPEDDNYFTKAGEDERSKQNGQGG